MNIEFNRAAFAKALHDAAWEKRLSNRDMATEAAVSPSTITRLIAHRKAPDADSLAKLLNWLGADFTTFIKRTKPKKK